MLIAALDEIVTGLQAYAITRATAAAKLQAALGMRHRDQRLQGPPMTLEDRAGYCYGAVLERIAQDFAGSEPLRGHIHHLATIGADLQASLPDFILTHSTSRPHL